MALLDVDSYDYYQTANIVQVYDAIDGAAATIVPGFGRCGTQCLKVTPTPASAGPIRGVAAGDNKAIIGVAINNVTGSNPPVLWTIRQGLVPIFRILRGLDGSIVGQANPDAAFPPTAFTSHGGLLQGNVWKHLGLEVVLAGSNLGSVIIAIDGEVVQTISGITTSVDGGTWTGVQLGGRQFTPGAICYYDDLYIMDGTGPAPWNALLGDVHVQRIRPVGAGDLTGFTVHGTAENWDAEDDNANPNIATYVDANSAGVQDSYVWEQIADVPGQEIFGVKESALARKDLAGNRFLEFLTRKAGVTYLEGTQLGIPTGDDTAYAYVKRVMMNDLATSAQWADAAAVNDSQFGMEIAT